MHTFKIKNKLILCILVLLLCFTQNIAAKTDEDFPDVNSEYYLMINLTNHKVEFEKGANERIYPASMTKVMTGLLVIENTRHFDKKITITANDLKNLEKEHASIAGFQKGEIITVRDALYGSFLSSGADATRAMARHMTGTQSEFVKLMNQKAAYLGMEDTHFTNPIGLHDENHYTTLHDMAILFEYAMENKKFKEVISTYEYHVKSNVHDDLGFLNSVQYVMNKENIDHSNMLGAKSGYTPQAGLCLVSIEEKDGQKYLLITAKADKEQNESGNLKDAENLYHYIFQKNKVKIVKKKGDNLGSLELGAFMKNEYAVNADEDISVVSPYTDDIKWKFISEKSSFIINKGDKIGEVIVYHGDEELLKKNYIHQNFCCQRK